MCPPRDPHRRSHCRSTSILASLKKPSPTESRVPSRVPCIFPCILRIWGEYESTSLLSPFNGHHTVDLQVWLCHPVCVRLGVGEDGLGVM